MFFSKLALPWSLGWRSLVAWYLLSLGWGVSAVPPACEIQVVEAGSQWPVSLVELKTTSNATFITDNAGRVAFDLPEFMGRETWLSVDSPGYGVDPDGFGSRGVRLTPMPGAKLRIEVKRTSIAKRLGRLTGAGLFSESQQLGYELDWRESGITGCDSVQNAVYDGKLFWAWGDTSLPGYPLGNFHMTGAMTPIDILTKFEPPIRIAFDYFRAPESGALRPICKMAGDGPTWMSGCVSLPDESGRERLVGTYVKIRPPLTAVRAGLAVWDEVHGQFQHHRDLWQTSTAAPEKPESLPEGNVVLWSNESEQRWALFGDPFPMLKCLARFESWQDDASWELLEPQRQVPISGEDHSIEPHRGAIAWSAFRNCWVTIFTQKFGQASAFGEVWFAEAETPFGPWKNAVKVLSHDHYSFYNPRLHPQWSEAEPSILLFEGTYANTFSKTATPTAKYDYNQILYRLDLNDPALARGR